MNAQTESGPMAADSGKHDEKRERNNLRILVVLLLFAAGIAGTAIVMQGLARNAAVQDCIASGRKDCVPLDTSQR
jgi:hypothetical protein